MFPQLRTPLLEIMQNKKDNKFWDYSNADGAFSCDKSTDLAT